MVCDEHWRRLVTNRFTLGHAAMDLQSVLWGMEEEKNLLSAAWEEPGLSGALQEILLYKPQGIKHKENNQYWDGKGEPSSGTLQDTRPGHGQHQDQQDPRSWGSWPWDTSAPHSFEFKKITEEVHTAVLGTKSPATPAWYMGVFFQHLVQMQISAVLHHSHLQPLCAPLV